MKQWKYTTLANLYLIYDDSCDKDDDKDDNKESDSYYCSDDIKNHVMAVVIMILTMTIMMHDKKVSK